MGVMAEVESEEEPVQEEPEAQVEAEEVDEPTAQPSPAPEEPPKEEKPRVSIDALHEERMRRKTLEQQLQKMEERFEQFRSKVETPPEPPAPAYEEDPGAHLLHEVGKVKQTAEELAKWKQAQQEAYQSQEAAKAYAQHFRQSEQQYASQVPDYDDAATFLRQSRIEEYKVLGWSEADAQQAVLKEAFDIAVATEQRGGNPPEVFYTLAKQRGYQRKPKESESSNLERIKENVEKTQSLGSTGSANKRPTLAQLAELDDEEFDKVTAGDNWAKLMGN